jgi:heme/copper-type cytochrome/quinol oxidase subunit 1
MQPVLLSIAFLAAPWVLAIALRRFGARHQAFALGLALTGLGLATLGEVSTLWPDTLVSQQAVDQAYQDTYYISARYVWLRDLGVLYLLPALALALIHGRTGPKRQRLGTVTVALWHLGVALIWMPAGFAPYLMPRRYIDFPGTLRWTIWASQTGAALTLTASVLLLGLTASLLYRRTPHRP